MNDRTMENIKKEKKHSLPQGWKIKKLSEIGNVFNGNSINAKIKKEKYLGLDNGLPYIGTKDIGFDSIIDYENGVKIPLTEKELFKIAPKNTPLICVEGGSAGRKIGFTNQDVCFGNKLFALVPNKSVNSRFLFYYYFSSSFQIHFSNEMTGIIGGVSMSKFKSIEIPLPPLLEQQRIVSILDEAFAAIAKAKANAEQNLKNAKELFESYLQGVFEKKGDGWKEQLLEDCFKMKSGDNLTAKNMTEGEYPVFGGNGIAGYHNEYNLSGSNVIIGRVGALCGNVRHITEKIWLTDNAFKVVDFKFDFDHSFLTYLLNYKDLRSYARQAAQPVISNSSLKDVVLNFPKSIETQKTIVRQLDALRAETQKLESIYQKKILLLEELKKSILQKAFSGELN